MNIRYAVKATRGVESLEIVTPERDDPRPYLTEALDSIRTLLTEGWRVEAWREESDD